MIYAVVWIHSGAVVYLGDSCRRAAEALESGTCYGKGDSTTQALQSAADWAALFRGKQQVLFGQPLSQTAFDL